jgi:hypothetical protein
MVRLNAEPKLQAAFWLRWASLIVGWLRCAWVVLIATRFALLVSFFGNGYAFIIGLSDTIVKEQIITFA